jgi:hypothetical protein
MRNLLSVALRISADGDSKDLIKSHPEERKEFLDAYTSV